MDQGRFDECEALLRSATARAGTHRAEARWGLVLLLRLEGRLEEARRWLEEGFDQMSSPVITLVRLYRLDHNIYPTDGIRQTLERSGSLAPQRRSRLAGKGSFGHASGPVRRGTNLAGPLSRAAAGRPRRLANAAGLGHRGESTRRGPQGTLAHLPAYLEAKTRPALLRAWFAAGQGNARPSGGFAGRTRA